MLFLGGEMVEIYGRERCEVFAEYVIENGATVRQTAANFGISKSTVHKDLTEKLIHINKNLHSSVKAVLAHNKSERHLRGGEATKRKYEQKKRRKRRFILTTAPPLRICRRLAVKRRRNQIL